MIRFLGSVFTVDLSILKRERDFASGLGQPDRPTFHELF
jgi:hypothetical protein